MLPAGAARVRIRRTQVPRSVEEGESVLHRGVGSDHGGRLEGELRVQDGQTVPDPLYRLTLLPPPARAFLSHRVGFEPAGLIHRRAQLGRQLAQGPAPDVPLLVLEDGRPLQVLLGGLYGVPPVPSLRLGPTRRRPRGRRELGWAVGMGRRGSGHRGGIPYRRVEALAWGEVPVIEVVLAKVAGSARLL